jgi:hypothetical protein
MVPSRAAAHTNYNSEEENEIQMSSKFQPALIAGGALGVVLVIIAIITALLPALGLLGCCACLLPIGAGVFAANQYVGKSPTPVQIADGAILGAIAGAVGGVVYLIIGLPIAYTINSAAIYAQMEQLRQAGVGIPMAAGFAIAFLFGIFGVIIDVILGVIGGLIGVAIFEKRKGGAGAPPPPPSYGGGPAGGGYGQGT